MCQHWNSFAFTMDSAVVTAVIWKACSQGPEAMQINKQRCAGDQTKILSEELLQAMVFFCDNTHDETFGTFLLTAWQFLLRVKAECVPLMRGSAEDMSCMTSETHNSVWVDENASKLYIRWF